MGTQTRAAPKKPSAAPAMPPRLAELWERYRQTRQPELRERLILEYLPLVKHVAGRLAVALPPYVEFNDLVGYGVFGLVEAIERYDVERGVRFETYAATRIRGAILDGLRAADWVPRSLRQKGREVEQAIARLEAQLGQLEAQASRDRIVGARQAEPVQPQPLSALHSPEQERAARQAAEQRRRSDAETVGQIDAWLDRPVP